MNFFVTENTFCCTRARGCTLVFFYKKENIIFHALIELDKLRYFFFFLMVDKIKGVFGRRI